MLDEGLDLLAGLLSGEAFDHRGEHYQANDVRFLPGPARQGACRSGWPDAGPPSPDRAGAAP